jgi:bifunctional non-homologous end joining protein LigD
VAQIRFTEWTEDGKLRHPAFQGLRTDKTPAEATRERPAAAPPAPKSAARKRPREQPAEAQKLTNPQRVLYPKDKITKAEIAAYYQTVSEPLLKALKDRPLTLIHWNQGIDKSKWFQQDIGAQREDWMTVAETPARGKTVTHLVADSERALQWLAQNSVLELHAWHSRAESLTQPDWVVFDLDPAEGRGIDQAIEVALLLRGMFDRLGLPCVPKTSGKRGLHLYIPLAKGHTYEDAQSFAVQVGETVAKQLPQVTLERSISQRKGRLYFDCMQNAYAKTVIAPYSPRGIEGAPVSAPLRWDEVSEKLDPSKFTIKTMPARLDKVGDLFEPALKNGVRLPRYQSRG